MRSAGQRQDTPEKMETKFPFAIFAIFIFSFHQRNPAPPNNKMKPGEMPKMVFTGNAPIFSAAKRNTAQYFPERMG
jgi:hypothetical protein